MPAVSKAQHGLIGLSRAVKSGEKKLADLKPGLQKKVSGIIKSMSSKDMEDFLSTPTKHLPKHTSGPRARVRQARSA